MAAAWQRELAAEVPAITAALGRPPSLAVVVVGQRPDSLLYVSRKLEACTQVRCSTVADVLFNQRCVTTAAHHPTDRWASTRCCTACLEQ